ncbi:hypothetical protein L6452_38657 [Arctium lappa]|uniref:Uncharacterized protein n=1 Tax=Arctium lappa TaxID=4217 RepID=A0ACB8XQQ6_ARCLA|nr:hypothetical protein L6452_38657 [Arctium lappa]
MVTGLTGTIRHEVGFEGEMREFETEEVKSDQRWRGSEMEVGDDDMRRVLYIRFFGYETLLSIPINYPKLSLLHLADPSALLNARTDPNTHGFTPDDSSITVATLIEMFSGLS